RNVRHHVTALLGVAVATDGALAVERPWARCARRQREAERRHFARIREEQYGRTGQLAHDARHVDSRVRLRHFERTVFGGDTCAVSEPGRERSNAVYPRGALVRERRTNGKLRW